ncbi:AhpC/TSA family protein [Leptolyngbya cf. ectocarpi LEGE 11479]|uniref:thioredoxin-dependent peroxiredoxin n=1 Tax=Leptolyngbya cf. ectocarpi LEGE 11479 TaxID=1828722 RepID=A0A928X1M2_LEPEC|nr:peroxiredoxin-like family protein [Leptolyngbya ectocarpi]MBE9066245.1 AhpC/TSA family protein [Leptolyngbya cf. ectocarpi LEGE 11479]
MTTTTDSLSAQLAETRAGFQQKVSDEIKSTMDAATEALESARLADQALPVGAIAPDFELPDATGNVVKLSTLLKQGPVVINFYRGEWCPYCNLELRAFQNLLPEFKQAGASLVAISPELPDHSLSVTEKHSLEFAVLSDVGNTVSRQYGLVFTLDASLQPIYQGFGIDIPTSNGDDSYELPMPATYVIDQSGRIRYGFAEADYTQRAEPQDVLSVVKELTV